MEKMAQFGESGALGRIVGGGFQLIDGREAERKLVRLKPWITDSRERHSRKRCRLFAEVIRFKPPLSGVARSKRWTGEVVVDRVVQGLIIEMEEEPSHRLCKVRIFRLDG